jgi:LacI family transcriptional regulator
VTGYETATRRLDDPEPPTAFICGSVFQARGVYRAIAEHGLRVGPDISVVCHDDGVRGISAEQFVPPLTATATSIRQAGEDLAMMLIDQIEARTSTPRRKILPFDLTLRESVGLAGASGGPTRALRVG